MRLPAFFLAVLVVASGCTNQRALIEAQHEAEVDSLAAVNRALVADLRTVRDSLQFLSDIDSGKYYREQRTFQDRIEKLEFDLIECRDGGRTLETLLVDDLFERGTATLTDEGREALAGLADRLSSVRESHVVRVEGHTDSVPLGPSLQERYGSNWELSAARATAVVRQLVDAHEFPADLMEVVGYGAARPVARNDAAEGRRLNRRVRIVVRPPGAEPLPNM